MLPQEPQHNLQSCPYGGTGCSYCSERSRRESSRALHTYLPECSATVTTSSVYPRDRRLLSSSLSTCFPYESGHNSCTHTSLGPLSCGGTACSSFPCWWTVDNARPFCAIYPGRSGKRFPRTPSWQIQGPQFACWTRFFWLTQGLPSTLSIGAVSPYH